MSVTIITNKKSHMVFQLVSTSFLAKTVPPCSAVSLW